MPDRRKVKKMKCPFCQKEMTEEELVKASKNPSATEHNIRKGRQLTFGSIQHHFNIIKQSIGIIEGYLDQK